MSRRKPSFETEQCDSTHSSVIEDQLRVVEGTDKMINYHNCSVLLCARCNLVLCDSLGVCGEATNIKSIVCLKVTKDVNVKEKLEVCMDGPLTFCTYKVIECVGCRRVVGVVLHSTPQHLSSLRSLFLLRKEVLNCYLLKNGTVIKASKISFENRPLKRSITELRDSLKAQLKQVDLLKGMLGEMSTDRTDKARF
ncbi:protein Mis18-beta [Brachyhypopomus gauderio]|uniref:protein Mis18-beta n=1 Tax=Brachyhypopomus gauderio TaxID=698409 RepID=UPI004040EB6D